MKYILGLTGQTGAGKSLVSKVAEEYGFFVIDCDKVAHAVTETEKVKKALTAVFGADILENGVLNRKKLAAAAFKDTQSTELLNKTVLPFIVEEINILIGKSGKERILLDAPTLFESGADKLCDKTVGVIADKDIRFKRIIIRDALTELQALQRINAGKPDEFYENKCDYILKNNGEQNEIINNFENMLKDILGR
ncbi:MAG: dephospho-CoA kinase [Ruminococcaceae bacterium]|nr:dephospho-CoA kinase [Oscillospiraceae bacterium]